ncbi:RNA polymerase sigma factor [Flavobacterium sp.]|uniref:RNA polymerase sigma factor n=1 Tax=Flavobacterium sp. TaxID=239 RepID=UPI00286C98D4|nr:RNA polymerase sigma factor [Flavobacterium sp.]
MIKKLKSNDNEVFNELVILYKNRVINTCYRFLLNKNDAEDVSQEVFIEIFQSIKSFRGDSKLSTWIFRIAVSKSLDEIKKRNRKKRISSIAQTLHLDDVAHWISGGKMPDEDLIASDNMAQINKALNKLPENQRIAFTLSKIDGFNNLEISEIMKTTTIAVESLIYRAKKKITADLEHILKK